jgi:YfiH family protein
MTAIRLYRSSVLPDAGFLHGFPERSGGVSTAARASLNLGVSWGDDRAVVETNRRLLAEHVGYDPAAVRMARHVHGTEVWTVGQPLADDARFLLPPSPAATPSAARPGPASRDGAQVPFGEIPEGYDGLVTDRAGAVLAAFAADCIPLLFAEPDARVCGAAHAGWRGTVGGIAANMVARMQALGARADRIRVALGPSIGPCCFEVGPEVVAAFSDALGDVAGLVVPGPHKDHIDLRVASRTILERAGVAPEHIDDRPPCTRCTPDRFFSYRRDGKAGGIHMSFIGMV